MKEMRGMQEKAKRLVVDYFNNHKDKTENVMIATDDTYIVWFCKTLWNWKALVSTTIPDGMYYEVTYNGLAGETYLDVYKKRENVVVPDAEENGLEV